MGIRIDPTPVNSDEPPLTLELPLDSGEDDGFTWVELSFGPASRRLSSAGRTALSGLISGNLASADVLLREAVIPEDKDRLDKYLADDGVPSANIAWEAAAKVVELFTARPSRRQRR